MKWQNLFSKFILRRKEVEGINETRTKQYNEIKMKTKEI